LRRWSLRAYPTNAGRLEEAGVPRSDAEWPPGQPIPKQRRHVSLPALIQFTGKGGRLQWVEGLESVGGTEMRREAGTGRNGKGRTDHERRGERRERIAGK